MPRRAPATGAPACLHHLVAAQAGRTPQAEALVCGTVRLTYRELWRRAVRLAARLQAAGVGPEVPVGVCAGRTPDLVVGLLAVLEAGGAYLPLDPAYPRERLGWMLADAAAPLVLADRAGAAALPAGVRVLPLGEPDAEAPAACRASRGSDIQPDHLAYLLYTSGSTGRPKGVAVPHRGAVALMRWARQAFSDAELAGVLAATSISFDLSVFEIFAPLCWGGRVILAADALELPALAAAGEVTLVDTVPSAMAELVRSGGLPGSVRTVCLAGEALRRALADEIYGTTAVDRLLNLYGPTEDATYSTWAEVARGEAGEPAIGGPLPAKHAVVQAAGGAPAVAGEAGELLLGGAGLARGYLGRPELTAERFVPDPEGAGERLYRTGDLVRRAPDGVLHYLGRLDQQVKIRGFRVEPGEIEAALLAHPEVRECAVAALPGPAGPRLAAYVAPRGRATALPDIAIHPDAILLDAAGLRGWLAARLPPHLLPEAWVALPALPRTLNGKVDRGALPPPAAWGPPVRSGGGSAAARTPLEARLAALFAEVLEVPEVGAGDDFFALGGQSLLALRLLGRLRRELGVERSLRDLLAAPTAAALAASLAREPERPGLERPRPVPLTRAGAGPLPLTPGQERLWLIHVQAPESAVYNVPLVCRLAGLLDPGALAAALGELGRRHEALRATFGTAAGVPSQTAADAPPPAPALADLAGLPAGRRARESDRLRRDEARRAFDLGRGPVMRALLLRLGGGSHRLLLTVHHIAWDDASAEVFLRELRVLYPAFAAGRPSPLPPPLLQAADAGAALQTWLAGPEAARRLAIWRDRLAGPPPPLTLPTDRPRAIPAASEGPGGRRWGALPVPVSAGLRAAGRRAGATPFAALFAGFAALLHRLADQDDLLIGTPSAGRQPETGGVIGFLADTLPLRLRLDGAPDGGLPWSTVVERARDTLLEALETELPFGLLVNALGGGAAPPLRVLFTLYREPPRRVELAPGLRFGWRETGNGTAKVDLSLFVEERGQGFGLCTEYDRRLFDAATAARWLGHLQSLLAAAAAAPGTPVDGLPLLAAAERAQLLREWSDTVRAFPDGRTLPELFAAQAACTPDAAALDFGAVLTYGELARRAEALAARLRPLGAGPEVPVALLAERSPALVVGILGILGAGSFYVPLDPGQPDGRLAWILRDAAGRGPVLLVAEGELAARPAAAGARIVRLGSDGRITGEPAGSGLDGLDVPDVPRGLVGADPRSLACLVYTSGSTGDPKGVAVPHRAVARLVLGNSYVELGPERRFGQLSNPAFDALTFEVWGALLHGACLVGVSRDEAVMPGRLVAAVRERGIDTAFLTAALFHQVAQEEPAGFAGMADLLVGGDAVDPGAVRRVLAAGPPRRLLNGYGPTESTTFALTDRFREVPAGVRALPIGRPLANTSARVVSRSLQPAPIGVPGELWLGGDGLARGYHGRSDLAAERFVPDPFGSPGERAYRTGDLARTRPDSVVEFLGRTDHQVKVRGFRVEPGEVEAVLAAHPEVRAAAVVAFEARPGDRQLAAFLVPSSPPGGEALLARVRDDLRRRLPEFLVPAAWTELPELPLNPNGKVDRQALAGRARPSAAPSAAGQVPPRSPLEEVLAGIWAEVLGVERVGVHDHFLDLGGHSLLAARLLPRLRAALDVDLPPRALFEAPTVAALAQEVERAERVPQPPPLAPQPRPPAPPLSFAQRRLWFLDRLGLAAGVYNVPVVWEIAGGLDRTALAAALAAVVRRHEALRTVFAQADGEPFQRVLPDGSVALAEVDLAALPLPRANAEAGRVCRAEARQPFDLERGPVLRARLLRRGPGDHLLALTLHHIAADAWSLRVLAGELSAFYAAAAGTVPPPLPAQYADFALWQRRWLDGATLAGLLAHWSGRLAGLESLELPADRPRPAVQEPGGALVRRALASVPRPALAELARRGDATRFMASLAAFGALLARLTGRTDLAVGTAIAGRNRLGLEGLIGFFANTLVLRLDLTGDPEFGVLLRRVRHAALDAWAHEDLPFERLVEELRPERHLARNPLVQVVFALHGEEDLPVPRLPGAVVRLLPFEAGLAKLDLTATLHERGGGLELDLEYGPALFDAPTMARWASHFETLLAGAVADPERRLSELPLLAAVERAQLLLEWNDTRAVYPQAALHELFAARAAAAPDAVAMDFGGRQTTYGELARRAGRLACRLRACGVGSEVPVGLLLDRSPEMVTALLATLAAGGAYLPLATDYPIERLAWMLEDAGVPVVITRAALAGRLPELARPPHLVTVDGAAPAGLPPEDAAPPLPAGTAPNGLAVIFYTSGSTGRPKGVAVPHRAVVRLLMDPAFLPLSPDDRVAHLSNVAFDAATLEIWGALLHGGRLIGVDREEALAPERLAVALAERGVTVAALPAALFHQVVAALPAAFAALGTVMVGGEAPEPRRMREALAAGPPGRLLNVYGPTEATTLATWFRAGPCPSAVAAGAVTLPIGRPIANTTAVVLDRWLGPAPAGVPAGAVTLPIGRPIANTTAVVLDRWLQPAPAGIPGELCLGGDALARGYLGRPDLTAARFVPDPAGGPGGRLYRTGDLARHRADGVLEFLGRTDHQVKIRGFRVEPGEIEAVLAGHPGVSQALVTPFRGGPDGDLRLAAYVVGRTGAPPGEAELRELLKQRLPAAMIPTVVVPLAALPLDAHGKLDRRRLPDPAARPRPDGHGAPPRTATERRVAAVWEELLGIGGVGVDDNFFDLGGHSLLMVRVHARLREAFTSDLSLIELFQYPDVRSLARRLEQGEEPEAPDAARLAKLRQGKDRLRARGLKRRGGAPGG